jgi:hypothetical protein
VTAGILIFHTPSQLDEASTLVDLLEASLSLPSGAIACSSLPGYTWAARNAPADERKAGFTQALEDAQAAIALVDDRTIGDAQLWFDVAAAWARGKRVAVLADHAERRTQIPSQLGQGEVIERIDRDAVVGLLEDIAFALGVRPRIGQDAQRAIEQLSSAPPPAEAAEREVPTVRPPKPEAVAARPSNGAGKSRTASSPALRASSDSAPALRGGASSYEEIESVPPPPGVPSELRAETDATEPDVTQPAANVAALRPTEPPLDAIEQAIDALGEGSSEFPPPNDEPYELDDGDFEPLRAFEPQLAPISCQLSLEAGRALSECSFHREEGGNFIAELERSFGCFVDAVGGNWLELKRIGDIEVWLAATDNLLDSLPEPKKYIAEWYEIGFQFATLQSLAAQGVPTDSEQFAVFQELWDQSMDALKSAAENARIPPRELRRQQALLENLVGPEQRRDYANVSRSLDELLVLAQAADRA